MPPTLREFKQLHPLDRQDRDLFEATFQSAALSAEHLIGDPHWERYLMRLQALLDECEIAKKTWLGRCAGAITETDRWTAQMNYHACEARVTTLKEVMALPKELIHAARPDLSRDRDAAR